MASSLITLFAFIFVTLVSSNQVAGELILDDGYTVKTVIDGHKLKINPHTILPRPGSSDLIILDSSDSTFFTVPFPVSQDEVVVKRLSGGGQRGYSDGEPGPARFTNPRSFSVDLRGNVYVADKANNVIRKISYLGVTTIAGGSSRKVGKEDGPAQNASFSSDFDLVFVPKLCTLLVSDHGNQLVRQIDLKPEDCATDSQSALGAVSIWAVGLVLSCLIGFVIGMAIRPYVIRGTGIHQPPQIQLDMKHYLINLVREVLMFCFAIRSEVASSRFYALLSRLFWMSRHHLSLMFRVITVRSQVPDKDFVSLMDTDVNNFEVDKSQVLTDQLKDLMKLNDHMQVSTSENELFNQEKGIQEESDALARSHGSIDDMIQANIMGFANGAKETSLDGSLVGITSLVKRR